MYLKDWRFGYFVSVMGVLAAIVVIAYPLMTRDEPGQTTHTPMLVPMQRPILDLRNTRASLPWSAS